MLMFIRKLVPALIAVAWVLTLTLAVPRGALPVLPSLPAMPEAAWEGYDASMPPMVMVQEDLIILCWMPRPAESVSDPEPPQVEGTHYGPFRQVLLPWLCDVTFNMGEKDVTVNRQTDGFTWGFTRHWIGPFER